MSLTLYLQCVGALEIAFRRSVSTVNESTIVITMDLSLLLSQCFKMLFVFLTGVSGSLLTFRFILKQTSMFKHFLKHSETFFLSSFSVLYFPRKKIRLIRSSCSVCMCSHVNFFNHWTKLYIIFPALCNNSMEKARHSKLETTLLSLVPGFSHDVWRRFLKNLQLH